MANFSELIGKTIIRIKKDYNHSLTFWCSDESKYELCFDGLIIVGILASIYNEKIDIANWNHISDSYILNTSESGVSIFSTNLNSTSIFTKLK